MINVKLDLKPLPVPLAFQPIYKIVMLLAILRHGCNRPYAASFLKINLYFWALRDSTNHKVLIDAKEKNRTSLPPWSFEPAIERTITLAVVNRFCERVISGKQLQVKLTDAGRTFLAQIDEKNFFASEIDRVLQIGVIAQKDIESINSKWTIN